MREHLRQRTMAVLALCAAFCAALCSVQAQTVAPTPRPLMRVQQAVSGVYYVQVDPAAQRVRHPALGALNGATRFYGPWHQALGGAYMDMGNAFLQQGTRDVMPEAGTLVMFPAFLQHKAMPYEGELDRIIVSFNAQFHAAGGDQIFDYAGA